MQTAVYPLFSPPFRFLNTILFMTNYCDHCVLRREYGIPTFYSMCGCEQEVKKKKVWINQGLPRLNYVVDTGQ